MDEVIGSGYEQESISEQVKNKVKEIKNSKVYKDIFSHPITGCYEHQDRVYEMVFHPNGNLCASWVDSERILDRYVKQQKNYK